MTDKVRNSYLDSLENLYAEKKNISEELMSLAIASDNQDLQDRFRYIRDDEAKHVGIVKMLRSMLGTMK